MKYAEKLKDPRWQKKRLEILQRDNFQCQDAGCYSKEKTLHVHHLDYLPKTDPWDYPNEFYLTLCVDCHNELHECRDAFEARILRQVRLKLRDTFILSCICEIFEKTEDLNDLIYTIWDDKFVREWRENYDKRKAAETT